MSEPLVILVGGFLGAGKTTLLAEAARRLTDRGRRVGLVTNDQAADLVDTAVLRAGSMPVEEVSGGCFCCRFDDLIGAMDRLVADGEPDVLLGEPVGSCTDLSATVMQPLKALHRDRYRLAPLTVLVDPERVREAVRPLAPGAALASFPENVIYIYRKQLEEADLIVVNKSDLLTPDEAASLQRTLADEYPQASVMSISARDGRGVDEWLEQVTSGQAPGRTVTDVDYDVYAEGEAALGWLNAAYDLRTGPETDWLTFGRTLMERLGRELRERSAEVAHLKIHLGDRSSRLVANLTRGGGEISLRDEGGLPQGDLRMLVNVRAHIAPGELRPLVERTVREAAGPGIRIASEDLQCFAPSRPQPTHRHAAVV